MLAVTVPVKTGIARRAAGIVLQLLRFAEHGTQVGRNCPAEAMDAGLRMRLEVDHRRHLYHPLVSPKGEESVAISKDCAASRV